MARYQRIATYYRQYYDDNVTEYCWYECEECERGHSSNLREIEHQKTCLVPKKEKIIFRRNEKDRKIAEIALKKLTMKEKRVLGLSNS